MTRSGNPSWWKRLFRQNPKSIRVSKWLGVESLERREVFATGIDASIDTGNGLLFINGTKGDDAIELRFESGNIRVKDVANNEFVPIRVTTGPQTVSWLAISRSVVSKYVIATTGDGNNVVTVIEDAANPATRIAIYGGQGNDELHGGSGDDTIVGLGGVDMIFGEGGNDRLVAGFGSDYDATPNGGEVLDGGDGNDTLIGGKGDDILIGGNGIDSYDGMGGRDTVSVKGIASAWVRDSELTLSFSSNTGGYAFAESSKNIEVLNFNFVYEGNGGQFDSRRFSGDVYVNGTQGADVYRTGKGNTTIWAGGGNDTLFASEGRTTFSGGDGFDLVVKSTDSTRIDISNTEIRESNGTATSIHGVERVDLIDQLFGKNGSPFALGSVWATVDSTRFAGDVSVFDRTNADRTNLYLIQGKLSTAYDNKVANILNTNADIAAKYRSLGGALGWLGKATYGELRYGDDVFVMYERGVIIKTATGAFAMSNTIFARYWISNSRSFLGNAVGDMQTLNGDQIVYFQFGAIVAPKFNGNVKAFEIHGAIYGKWLASGGLRNAGAPKTDESSITMNGIVGAVSRFVNADIYWSPNTGARMINDPTGYVTRTTVDGSYQQPVRVAFRNWIWSNPKRDLLGFPTSDIVSGPRGGFLVSFTSGTLLWSPKTGMHETNGEIDKRYRALGGPWGQFGYPKTDETSAVSGTGKTIYMSYFEGGYIWFFAETSQSLAWAYRNNPQGGVRV